MKPAREDKIQDTAGRDDQIEDVGNDDEIDDIVENDDQIKAVENDDKTQDVVRKDVNDEPNPRGKRQETDH